LHLSKNADNRENKESNNTSNEETANTVTHADFIHSLLSDVEQNKIKRTESDFISNKSALDDEHICMQAIVNV